MKKGAVWLLLGIVIAGVYANALGNGFVFDDYLIVLSNPALPRVVKEPWLALSLNTLGYRPLRTLSYVLDFSLGGVKPWLFHFNNILYHWITAGFVFLVAFRLTNNRTLRPSDETEVGGRPTWQWLPA